MKHMAWTHRKKKVVGGKRLWRPTTWGAECHDFYTPNQGIKIKCDMSQRVWTVFPVREMTWLILFCRKITLAATLPWDRREGRLRPISYCANQQMAISNGSEDEEKPGREQLHVVESIGLHAYLLKMSFMCDYLPFSIFFGIDLFFAWKKPIQ